MKSGQVGLGRIWTGRVGSSSGQVGSGLDRPCHVGSDQVMSGQVRSGRDGQGGVGTNQVGMGREGSGRIAGGATDQPLRSDR